MSLRPIPFWSAITATLLLSLFSLSFRHRVEANNRAVAPLMEADTIRDIAASSGVTFTEALAQLCASGLGGIVAAEATVDDLVRAGLANLQQNASSTDVVVQGPPERVFAALTARFPSAAVVEADRITIANATVKTILDTPIGLDPEGCDVARDLGMVIVARHANVVGAGPGYIRRILSDSNALGANVYLPVGDQVLGQREEIETVAAVLRDLGMYYAPPEFTKIAGDAKVARLMQDRLLRLHSIQSVEVDKMSPGEVLQRLTKAYRERTMRLLLVRPVTTAAADPLAIAETFFRQLRYAIAVEGGVVKPPKPTAEPGVPAVVFPLLGLAIAWSALLIASAALRRERVPLWGYLLVLAGLGCVLPEVRPLFAVLAAVTFPIGAYTWLIRQEKINVIGSFLALSLISLVGGLAVAGLLNQLPYLVKVAAFPAVKVSHFLPIVVVGVLLAARHYDLRTIARTPVAWGGLILGLIGLLTVAFMLMRTGNESPAGVSGIELRLRNLLDHYLYARPRTKELFVGHPALLIGLILYGLSLATPVKRWLPVALALLTLGAIGQTSIVNTMCHFHTPLDLSLARIATGWVLGGILGWIVWLVVGKLLGKSLTEA